MAATAPSAAAILVNLFIVHPPCVFVAEIKKEVKDGEQLRSFLDLQFFWSVVGLRS
jgi:thioredoxin-related protein